MLISKYIFVIYLRLYVTKRFRGVGVGGEGKASRILKFDIFPLIFCKKRCFLVSSGESEILPLLPPLCKSVGAGKILSLRRIFARRRQTCPKSFVWILPTNVLPQRTLFGAGADPGMGAIGAIAPLRLTKVTIFTLILYNSERHLAANGDMTVKYYWNRLPKLTSWIRPCFGVTSKKGFMCFSANVGHHFLKSKNAGRHFCPDFNKSKQLGHTFTPFTPTPGKSTFGPCLEKILLAPMFRGTCSSTEILKG